MHLQTDGVRHVRMTFVEQGRDKGASRFTMVAHLSFRDSERLRPRMTPAIRIGVERRDRVKHDAHVSRQRGVLKAGGSVPSQWRQPAAPCLVLLPVAAETIVKNT